MIIDDPQAMRDTLYREWNAMSCLGRIYIAEEGINAQMSVPEPYWEVFEKLLYSHKEFQNVPFKIAVEDDGKSFLKLIAKVRKQIVADGLSSGGSRQRRDPEDRAHGKTEVGERVAV